MALATRQPSTVQQLAVKLAGPPNQDVKTVKILRLCVGIIGASLPVTLLIWNAIEGSGTIVPASMSGSYYTSARNLFVGSLCALGVFLFGSVTGTPRARTAARGSPGCVPYWSRSLRPPRQSR